MFFVGYPKETKGYYFYNPSEHKVFVARNGHFLEREFISKGSSGSKVTLEEVQDPQDTQERTMEEPFIPSNVEEPVVITQEQEPPHSSDEIRNENEVVSPRRSNRIRHEIERYGFLVSKENDVTLILDDEPRSYKEAIECSDSNKWHEAMKAEMQSMYDNQVWKLIDPPPDSMTIGCKWVFKKKTDMDGKVHTYKARLVAKGFKQTHGIDYEETFSPAVMIKSIRILLAIAALMIMRCAKWMSKQHSLTGIYSRMCI